MITVYGASDDCIEIEGDIRDEFCAIDGGRVAFSDGTVLDVAYTNSGVWRIEVLVAGTAACTIERCSGDEDDDNYSDRATLDATITSARLLDPAEVVEVPVETPEGATTTLVIDDEARATIVAALDLYQRIAIGQFREVCEVAEAVVGDTQASPFSELGDALMDLRGRYATDPALRHPNASLGIRQGPRRAQVAYDVWHALGGGMTDRADYRLTDAHIETD